MEKVIKGDYVSRISYMKITSTSPHGALVMNENGLEWTISNGILTKECVSASEFAEEKTVNRTELIGIFTQAGDTVFTVNFDKQAKPEDFLEATRGEGNKILSFEDMKKKFKKIKGENRTLIGYMIDTENGFGRSNVIDLEIDSSKHRIRQVDHRHLNWLVLKGVKYTVK